MLAENAQRRSTAWSALPRLNGLEPEAYLREVLIRITDHPGNRIEETRAREFEAEAAASNPS
jgi:hypothetical protein